MILRKINAHVCLQNTLKTNVNKTLRISPRKTLMTYRRKALQTPKETLKAPSVRCSCSYLIKDTDELPHEITENLQEEDAENSGGRGGGST